MSRFIHSKPVWQFLRRSFAGIVLIYVLTSWLLGETPIARPVYYALTALWLTLLLVWLRIGQHPRFDAIRLVRGKPAAFLELAAFILAFTLFPPEYCLRLLSSCLGRSGVVAYPLAASRLVPVHH